MCAVLVKARRGPQDPGTGVSDGAGRQEELPTAELSLQLQFAGILLILFSSLFVSEIDL